MYGLDAVASIQKRKETSIIGLTHENTTPINTTVIAVEPFTRLEVHGAFPHLGSVPCRMARSYLASFGFVENGHGMRYSVPMHDTAETILKELLDAAGVAHSGVVRSELAGQILYSIQAADPRSLIGVHGDTVHALDHLVKKILEGKLPAPPPAADERPADKSADDGGARALLPVRCGALAHERVRAPHRAHDSARRALCEDGIARRRPQPTSGDQVFGRLIPGTTADCRRVSGPLLFAKFLTGRTVSVYVKRAPFLILIRSEEHTSELQS